jgi:hypothetical protein
MISASSTLKSCSRPRCTSLSHAAAACPGEVGEVLRGLPVAFVKRVAGTPHYDGTRRDAAEPAVIAISGLGPVDQTLGRRVTMSATQNLSPLQSPGQLLSTADK